MVIAPITIYQLPNFVYWLIKFAILGQTDIAQISGYDKISPLVTK
jgi:hypothetical protein